MALCSFTKPNIKDDTNEFFLTDDEGWEDYKVVRAIDYDWDRQSDGWKRGYNIASKAIVQRRAWCGESEYRFKDNDVSTRWIRVSTNCPIEGYKYCAQYGERLWVFNMY